MAENSARVVRWDITPNGIRMRMWIDDLSGRHLCVAEMDLGTEYLCGVVRQVNEHLAREAQRSLF